MSGKEAFLTHDLGATLKWFTRTYKMILQSRVFCLAHKGQAAQPLLNARKHYQSLRYRNQFFGNPELFGDPGWDMLVDLFIAIEEGRRLTAAELCAEAGVPLSTAYRWLTLMESRGLVVRSLSENNLQQSTVIISAQAREDMKRFFCR